MPAEWSPQRRVWMAWPVRADNWRDQARPAQRAFAAVANTVSDYEDVVMVVPPTGDARPGSLLSARVEQLALPTNDAWLRDTGPSFVRNVAGERRAVDWIFNAWGGLQGGLYHPWDDDDALAARIAEACGVARYRAPLVLEGGSIHVDGEGTCLTTEECLLNSNRNPALSRAEIELHLRDYLGVEQVLWLGRGLLNDETDGHVDNLCCFLRPGVVALAWTEDRADPQRAACEDAWRRLREARDARGRALEIVKLPNPRDPVRMTLVEAGQVERVPGTLPREAGLPLAASYVNFLICNGAVVVPAFGDAHDDFARGILAEQFPGRDVRVVPGREILLGGGNVHCITQQEPA